MRLGRTIGRARVVAATLGTGLAAAALASAAWHPVAGGTGRASAKTDFRPPVVSTSVLALADGAAGGYVAAGRGVIVYANASDPSGVASLAADLSSVADAASSVRLDACTSACTVDGVTYAYRTATVTTRSSLAQGAVSYTVRAADGAANAGTTTFGATVDTTAPTVSAAAAATVQTGAGGWLRAGAPFMVYANVSDGGAPPAGIAGVTVDVSSLAAGQSAVALTACTAACVVGGVTYAYRSSQLSADASLAAGGRTASVTAVDRAGNAATTQFTVTVDNTSPVVTASVLAPPSGIAGWVAPGGTYYVYANASDAVSGISSVSADVGAVTASASAVPLAACSGACTVGGTTYAYRSSALVARTGISGALAYSVAAVDRASNGATAPGFSVSVDTSPAIVSAAVVANTATVAGGVVAPASDFHVYANITDPETGVASASARVKDFTAGAATVAMSTCSSACTVAGITYAYKSAMRTSDALPDGAHSFTITSTNGVGTSATSAPFGVTIDGTAPTVSSTVLTNGVTGASDVLRQGSGYEVFAAAADGVGIGTVSANVAAVTAGQTAAAMSAGSYTVNGASYGWRTAVLTANATLAEGAKAYSVTAVDLAGNTTTLSTGSASVDNTAPAVAITFPGAGYTTGWLAGCSTAAVADVCGTVADAGSGIKDLLASMREGAGAMRYWSNATASFSSASETFMAATVAGGAWNLGFAGTRMTAGSAFTLRAVATDGAGNTAAATRTFTYQP